MSQYVGYIINLSTSFNAGNYLHYFLPAISGQQLLLFDEVTKQQLVSHPDRQEKEIHERFWEIKNHWDLQLINPEKEDQKLVINIILDFAPWSFSGFGNYSMYPFAKLYSIQQIIKTYFNQQERDAIRFQYFFLAMQSRVAHKFLQKLDDQKAILPKNLPVEFGDIDIEAIHWPIWDQKLETFLNKNYHDVVKGYVTDQAIDDDLRNLFENDIDLILAEKQPKVGGDAEAIQEYVKHAKNQTKDRFLTEIQYFSQLQNPEIKKEILASFFHQFSSSFFMRPNKDLFFNYCINDQNTKEKIASFERLSAFLVESVSMFQAEDRLEFLGSDINKPILFLKDVKFNEDEVTKRFKAIRSFSVSDSQAKNSRYEEKLSVTQFQFSQQVDTSQFYTIDEKKANQFISVKQLLFRIPYFFTQKRVNTLHKRLEDNSIDELEQEVLLQGGRANEALKLNGNYGLSETQEKLTYKEIEYKLKQLEEEEQKETLSSRVNLEQYQNQKESFRTNSKVHIQSFIQSMALLPKVSLLTQSLIGGTLLVMLLFTKLYEFVHWKSALIFSAIFLTVISISAVISLLILRNQVIAKFGRIKTENQLLYDSFLQYVQSLKQLAIHVRKSTLRRKNMEELSLALKAFVDHENQVATYHNFYEDMIQQLKKNKVSIPSSVATTSLPNYKLPPYLDARILSTHKLSSLKVLNNKTEIHYPNGEQEYTSVLGIINQINLS